MSSDQVDATTTTFDPIHNPGMNRRGTYEAVSSIHSGTDNKRPIVDFQPQSATIN
ncbi:LCCL domain-containing protein [Pyrenophora tritici-repentis]|nr:LCCL domain-containing protein [Pyrenophora tritici-repentis]KAI0612164.1 LCCL domain-containing protein [Pyrenophora tritici-repentis]KAI0624474.1 LCCL domain-containing protein [Pyrenophora tritici-repentis]